MAPTGSLGRTKNCFWFINVGIQTTQCCWEYFNQDIADYLIFRAGCWEDNALKVVDVLQEIRKRLLENAINDKM